MRTKIVSRLATLALCITLAHSFELPNAYGITEVNNHWDLTTDFTGSIRLTGVADPNIAFPVVNLNGHKITIDSGGIEVNPGTRLAQFRDGILTSSESFLETRFLGQAFSAIGLNVVIADSSHKVGLRITGNGYVDSGFYLYGGLSNTFTGNVEVSGIRNHLVLRKTGGAIAVRSNILVKDGAILRFEGSNQLLRTSSVTLKTNGVLQNLSLSGSDITNTFKSLVVEDNGIVHFNHTEGNSANAKYYIYLDDLIINQGAHLEVKDWQDGRDFLLVRKNSQNLADALERMAFEGYNPADIHLRNFNSTYWQISALPEPSTYGAIVSIIGLGFWALRRRKRHPRS